MFESLNILANFVDGSQSSVALTLQSNPHAVVEFMPGESLDISTLEFQDTVGETKETIVFESQCMPDYPVYIKWLNRFGGYEYYMFDGHKTFSNSFNPQDSFYPAEYQGVDSVRTRATLYGEASETISIGDDFVEYWKYLMFADLIGSNQIWVYNKDREDFEAATLDSKTTLNWNSKNSNGQVGITIRLIDQETRF